MPEPRTKKIEELRKAYGKGYNWMLHQPNDYIGQELNRYRINQLAYLAQPYVNPYTYQGMSPGQIYAQGAMPYLQYQGPGAPAQPYASPFGQLSPVQGQFNTGLVGWQPQWLGGGFDSPVAQQQMAQQDMSGFNLDYYRTPFGYRGNDPNWNAKLGVYQSATDPYTFAGWRAIPGTNEYELTTTGTERNPYGQPAGTPGLVQVTQARGPGYAVSSKNKAPGATKHNANRGWQNIGRRQRRKAVKAKQGNNNAVGFGTAPATSGQLVNWSI